MYTILYTIYNNYSNIMLTLYTLINHPQVRIDEDLRSNFRLDSSPVLPYRANYAQETKQYSSARSPSKCGPRAKQVGECRAPHSSLASAWDWDLSQV